VNVCDQGPFYSMEGVKETFVVSFSAVMHRLIMLEVTGI
jgi:predicted transcriptional regulator